MLVGREMTGKTSVYRVLQGAITMMTLKDENCSEFPVETFCMNPKSITHSQLYGQYDSISQEFTDGVLGSIFRRCVYSADAHCKRRWIVFDGPVDANWIEDMNTLLDENKKLCLMNGEVIRMTNLMNMVFENHDLSRATAATISRCGMVYCELGSMGGWRSLVESWVS